jgi:hypothetical protein
MSIEASYGICAATGKLWIDAADAVRMFGEDCGCFASLLGEFVLELLEEMLWLQLS